MNAEAETENSTTQIVYRETPLFALKTWLYPGIPLQLQVFEPRYLDMVTTQLKKGQGFGVVAIRQGREVGDVPRVFPLGVMVQLTDWQQQPNGLLGITVQGEKRFRVVKSWVEESGLMMAETESMTNVPGLPLDESMHGLVDILDKLKQHESIKPLRLPPVHNSAQLSWQLSYLLPLNPTEKMALLALSEPTERLDCIARKINALSVE